MTTSLCFSRLARGLALGATVLSFACANGGCGDAQSSKKPTRDARVSGSVEVCSGHFGKCSLVAATVTLLSVHGAALGGPVDKTYATHGRFSFVVAPGTYFPSASTAQARVADRRCIAGESRTLAQAAQLSPGNGRAAEDAPATARSLRKIGIASGYIVEP
jgi:hypothetical protein